MSENGQALPCPAVLLIGFNRPDSLSQTIRALSSAAPPTLYVACDGPRKNHPTDHERVTAVRKLMLNVPWECKIHKRFLDENQGCARAVSGAITWLFEHEPAGIILEDDCVPHPTFFQFAAETLEHYQSEERIGCINGSSVLPPDNGVANRCYLSRYASSHGWATWRRAWKHFLFDAPNWQTEILAQDFMGSWHSRRALKKWQRRVEAAMTGRNSSWLQRWRLSMWRNKMLAVVPQTNLISNIGYGQSGTHTQKTSPWSSVPSSAMQFPLIYPDKIEADDAYDRCAENWRYFSQPAWKRHSLRLLWKAGVLSDKQVRGWGNIR